MPALRIEAQHIDPETHLKTVHQKPVSSGRRKQESKTTYVKIQKLISDKM